MVNPSGLIQILEEVFMLYIYMTTCVPNDVGTGQCAPEVENDVNVYMTDVGGKIPMPECVHVCVCLFVYMYG